MIDPNRRFAELAGLYWWKFDNPDFTDAREVLKVMKCRGDWFEFCASLNTYDFALIADKLLLTPGALRDKAIEWMEGKHD
jgi:hypothetical protein